MSSFHARHNVLLILVLSILVVGLEACGKGASSGEGAASPAEAVEKFADAAGSPKASRRLGDACRFISPALRLGYSRMSSCARILPLYLFYAGETTGIPGPTAFTAKAGRTEQEGKLAFVETSIDYEGTPDPSGPVTVLAVRESGRWWVATPPAFNPAYPILFTRLNAHTHGDSDKETLLVLYEQELEASGKAKDEDTAEREAQTALETTVDPCPAAGRSSVRDPRRDIEPSQGIEPVSEQPPADDVVEALHAIEGGGTACFALRFAGGSPSSAEVKFEALPVGKVIGRQLTVRWEAGRVNGAFTGPREEQVFVPVHAGREGSTVVIRLPARVLGTGTSAYRWTATVFVPTGGTASLMDRVPMSPLAVSARRR